MQKIGAYKETIVFVSCAAVLAGTVLALQNATAPSHHRRRATSSASRSGTAARSTSHGPPGVRSRSSSRPHRAPTSHTHNSALHATTPPVDRLHTSRNQAPTHTHNHRHHSHPRNSGPGPACATSCGADPTANLAQKLTVDAVAQHKQSLGTASALQGSKQEEITGISAPRRGLSSTRGNQPGGSRSGEDGFYYRCASNAATVGSQAPYSAPPITVPLPTETVGTENTSPEAAHLGEEMLTHLTSAPVSVSLPTHLKDTNVDCNGRVDEVSSPLPTTSSAPAGDHAVTEKGANAEAAHRQTTSVAPRINCSATQTPSNGLGENGGAQTETIAASDAAQLKKGVDSIWRVSTSTMISPQSPTNGVNHRASADQTKSGSPIVESAAIFSRPVVRSDKHVASDDCSPEGTTAVSGGVPLFFIRQMERQLRILVHDVSRNEWNDRKWMSLYTYLSELPVALREVLASRGRCGAAIVAQLVEKRRAQSFCEGNRVEDAIGMLDKNTNEDVSPSPQEEILHLLERGTSLDPDFHIEWRGSTMVYVEGRCNQASRKGVESQRADGSRAYDVPGVQLPSAAPSSTWPSFKDEELEEEEMPTEDGEQQQACLLAFIAAHIKRYKSLSMRVVGTQFPEPEVELSQTSLGTTPAIRGGGEVPSTLLCNQDHDAQRPLSSYRDDRYEPLTSLLSSFVRLRHSAQFQALRHTSQHALFACDFIELAAEAERLVERASVSPDPSLMLRIPVLQKRMVTDVMDARDSSVGPCTSVGSESTPLTSHSARQGVKVRTPLKPSARVPIQCTLPNSPLQGD